MVTGPTGLPNLLTVPDPILAGTMSFSDNRKAVDCHCTRCRYNSNRTCGYQGRLVIDANGECEIMTERGGGPDQFP